MVIGKASSTWRSRDVIRGMLRDGDEGRKQNAEGRGWSATPLGKRCGRRYGQRRLPAAFLADFFAPPPDFAAVLEAPPPARPADAPAVSSKTFPRTTALLPPGGSAVAGCLEAVTGAFAPAFPAAPLPPAAPPPAGRPAERGARATTSGLSSSSSSPSTTGVPSPSSSSSSASSVLSQRSSLSSLWVVQPPSSSSSSS